MTDKSSLGELFLDGSFNCYTLEDRARLPGIKVPGKTAIPEGTYEVIISYSQKFKQNLPLLLNVPNLKGVRIHPGNRPEDTEGCILVGTDNGTDAVFNSRIAFKRLFDQLNTASRRGKIYLTIKSDIQDDLRTLESIHD